MGTYRTTRIPGSRDGDKRLLGVNTLGQAAYLTRVCPPGHPSRSVLERFVKAPLELRDAAGLVEIAEDESGVYVVEVAEPSLPLQVVVDRAQAVGKSAAPDLAAWMAMRVCQVSASLRAPHLRLSLRNVLVRPDGEPYVLGAQWARLLPPDPDDAPFVPPQPLEDAKVDAFAAAAIARALAGGIEGFPPPLKSALEAASGGPGWAWMLPAADAAAALEKALGAEAVRTAPARLSAWLRSLSLPSPAPLDPGAPTLRLMPVNRLNTSEELALPGPPPGGPAMSLDGRVDGPVGRSAKPMSATTVPQTRMSVPREPEKLELDESALAHATAPAIAESGSMVHKVHAELEEARARRNVRRAVAVVAAVLLLAAAAAAAFFLRPSSAQLSAIVGRKEVTALLRVETTPPGATVSIAGQQVGETPFVCLNEYEGSSLKVELAGYEPASETIGPGTRTLRLVLKRSGLKAPGGGPNRAGVPLKRPKGEPRQ